MSIVTLTSDMSFLLSPHVFLSARLTFHLYSFLYLAYAMFLFLRSMSLIEKLLRTDNFATALFNSLSLL